MKSPPNSICKYSIYLIGIFPFVVHDIGLRVNVKANFCGLCPSNLKTFYVNPFFILEKELSSILNFRLG